MLCSRPVTLNPGASPASHHEPRSTPPPAKRVRSSAKFIGQVRTLCPARSNVQGGSKLLATHVQKTVGYCCGNRVLFTSATMLTMLVRRLRSHDSSSADHFGHELLQFLTAETGGGWLSGRRGSAGSVLGRWARFGPHCFRVRDGLHGSSLESRFGTQPCGPSLVWSERNSPALSGAGVLPIRVLEEGGLARRRTQQRDRNQGWLDQNHLGSIISVTC